MTTLRHATTGGRRLLAALLVSATTVACGPPPKAPEMVSFEQMRAGEQAQSVADQQPELYAEAEGFYRKALKLREDGEMGDAVHATQLASITWRAALARLRQKDHVDATLAAQSRTKRAEERRVIASRREKVATGLLERQKRLIAMQVQLAAAQANAKAERRASQAKTAVDAAALKLKEAEAVNAAVHAPGPFNKAQASLKMALDAFTGGNYPEAESTAKLALVDATSAITAATPKWGVEEKKRTIEARLRSLLDKSATIPGAEARIERRGLVLTVRELFKTGKTHIAPERELAVQLLGKLASEYSEFRMLVEGHTDNRGRASRNLKLSQERAEAVVMKLSLNGVLATRMTALGQGDHEPVADNSKKAGRAQNRRVDVVFLRP